MLLVECLDHIGLSLCKIEVVNSSRDDFHETCEFVGCCCVSVDDGPVAVINVSDEQVGPC